MNNSTQTEFVMYLLSNASMNVYPDNKPQSFQTRLAQPLDLPGLWEVGLSSIQYPNNWNTLRNPSSASIFMQTMPVGETVYDVDRDGAALGFELPAGQYASLDSIVAALNRIMNDEMVKYFRENPTIKPYKFKELSKDVYLELKPRTLDNKRYELDHDGDGIALYIPAKNREVWTMLGVDKDKYSLAKGGQPRYQASVNLHFPSLLVYTPMIRHQTVGDTQAPLLAIVPVKGKIGEYVYQRFDKPIYCELAQNHISEIEISIKDDSGGDIPFLAGKVVLVLHFRKRSS